MTRADVPSRRDFNRALLAGSLSLLAGAPARAAVPLRPLFDFAIAGGWHHALEAARSSLVPGMTLILRREPDNPYDGNAIAVHHPDGRRLGYVPRAANPPVARLMDAGDPVAAEIVRMVTERRPEGVAPGLVFTGFTIGDPVVRLSAAAPDSEAGEPSAPAPAG